MKADKQVTNIRDFCFSVPFTSLDTEERKGMVRHLQVWCSTEVKLKTSSKF